MALLRAAGAASGLPIAPPGSSRATIQRAERLVRAGGPAYVKLGQFIATAPGLLPSGWVDSFAWCRDRVPALPPEVVNNVIRQQLGELSRLRELDPAPLAAASIAQVHAGVLDDGTGVAVKIRRPGLHRQLRSDIETMALLAGTLERLHPAAQVANLTGFVELFAQLALEELDLRLEALNLVELGAALEDAGVHYCRVPRPIPGMVTDGVLVMERLSGVSYDRAADAYGQRLDGERMLELAIRAVLETTLIYGLFHGDLHAGNVLIDGGDRFALVDFGICGRITAEQRGVLVRFMLAFAQMNAVDQLRALEEFGAFPADVEMQELATELEVELERIDPASGASLTFEQLGRALTRLLRILSAHRFRLPKELILFFKNLLYLTSFAASVAPEADLLSQIAPVLDHFTRKYGSQLSEIAA
jgi:ubiquinone biosynthesis protein